MSLDSNATERVTVVIPGRNCARTLSPCLQALSPLIESQAVAEILFVDDASSDKSSQVADEEGARVLSCPGLGPGAARNVGWRAARTPLIWFVDADCVPENEALALLLEMRREGNFHAVGGSYANRQGNSLVARLIHAEMVARHRRIGARSNFAITANLLCEREVLEHVGGFDENLKLAQDLDLAYRIVASGRHLGFNWRSRVAHFHETNFGKYLYKQARQGYWRTHLYRKHPHRMVGDRYSGLLDYAQPPLAVAGGALFVLGSALWASGRPMTGTLLWIGGTSAGGLLIGLQLPMALRLAEVTALERLAFLPFGVLRAAGRGVGMVLGLLQPSSS